VGFLPEGRVALSASNDGTVAWIEAADGKLVRPLQTYPKHLAEMALSPDGKALLVVAGGSVHVADAASGAAQSRPFGKGVLSAAWSPDGRAVLIGTEDGSARLCDAATGAPTIELQNHTRPVRRVAVAPHGRTLATVTEDGRLRLWDAATGRPVGPMRRHDPTAGAPAFSADGRSLLAVYGGASVWAVPGPWSGEPLAGGDLGAVLTRLTMDARGDFTPLDAPPRDSNR
jgi:WD40 repeat protein